VPHKAFAAVLPLLWAEGADRFRNPDDDLPADSNAKRSEYYTDLNQPQDAEQFI
jgi:hypothetical protein